MGILLGDLTVRYKADVTDLTVKSAMADAAISGTAATARAADTGLGNLSGATKFGKIFAGAMLLAGAVAVGFGVVSAKMAGDFQVEMTKLYTTAGESKDNLKMVGDGILAMSSQVGTGALKLGDAMYWIESGGLHGKAGLDALRIAAEGAKSEGADLNDVSIALAASLNSYKGTGLTAAAAMNTLIGATGQGMMTMQELAGSLKNILPASAKFHISLIDVTSALATMTAQGDDSASAATHLRQMILALEAPAKAGASALKSVGLSSQQVSDEMKVSLPGAIQMITDAVGKKFPEGSAAYNQAIKNIAGGSKQMMGFLELSGQHLATFSANVAKVSDVVKQGGSSVMGWADIQQNFNFKMDAAKAAVESLMITAGTQLLPVLGNLLTKVTPLITGFTQWLSQGDRLKNTMTQVSGAISGFITTVSGIVNFFKQNQLAFALLIVGVIALAGAIGGVLVASLVAAAVAAWAAMVPLLPFIAIGALVALVIAGIVIAVMHWGEIAHWLQGVWGSLVGWLGGVWNGFASWFMGILHSIGSFFVGIWTGIKNATMSVWNFLVETVKSATHLLYLAIFGPFIAIGALFTWLYNHNYYVKALVDSIVGFFKAGFKWMQDAWTNTVNWLVGLWNTILSDVKSIWQKVSDVFSSIWSTYISGPLGRVRDAIIGWISNEYALFVSGFNVIWAKVSGIFSSIWDTYVSKPLQHVRDMITGWFNSLVKGAGDAGTNFINMLVQGITSGAGAIWNAVSGIAKNIWSALGFHSPPEAGPAKDADQWMPNLIKMLVSGLNAGIPQIKTASQNIAAPLQGQLAYPIKPSAVAVAAASQNASSSPGQQTFILEVDGHKLAEITNRATDRTVRLKLGAQGRAN